MLRKAKATRYAPEFSKSSQHQLATGLVDRSNQCVLQGDPVFGGKERVMNCDKRDRTRTQE